MVKPKVEELGGNILEARDISLADAGQMDEPTDFL